MIYLPKVLLDFLMERKIQFRLLDDTGVNSQEGTVTEVIWPSALPHRNYQKTAKNTRRTQLHLGRWVWIRRSHRYKQISKYFMKNVYV